MQARFYERPYQRAQKGKVLVPVIVATLLLLRTAFYIRDASKTAHLQTMRTLLFRSSTDGTLCKKACFYIVFPGFFEAPTEGFLLENLGINPKT